MIDKDDMRVRMHLRTFIPDRLEELGMSEADLSRATGDSRKQISRAAKGENTPSLAFGLRLATALNCTLDELTGREVLTTTASFEHAVYNSGQI